MLKTARQAASWLISALSIQRMKIVAIGVMSIIPIRGMMRLIGLSMGSVIWSRILTSGQAVLPGLILNQDSNTLKKMVKIRTVISVFNTAKTLSIHYSCFNVLALR